MGNMINSSREIFIFYLKNDKQISEEYLYLSDMFKNYGISLVPVTLKELREIKHNNREYIISISSSLTKYGNFLRARKSFLDHMVLAKKFCLYDISSFAMANISAKGFRNKSYHYFQLPLEVKEVVKSIALSIYEDRRTKLTWPGGVRSKLPSDVGSKM